MGRQCAAAARRGLSRTGSTFPGSTPGASCLSCRQASSMLSSTAPTVGGSLTDWVGAAILRTCCRFTSSDGAATGWIKALYAMRRNKPKQTQIAVRFAVKGCFLRNQSLRPHVGRPCIKSEGMQTLRVSFRNPFPASDSRVASLQSRTSFGICLLGIWSRVKHAQAGQTALGVGG